LNTSNNILAVVLAAGASTRMGEPKQLLPWKNSTLLQYTIDNLKQIGFKEIIVVLGANYHLILPKIDSKEISIIENKNWQDGIGSSISFASEFIYENKYDIDGVFFLLADQPFVTLAHLNITIKAFKEHSLKIVATSYNKNRIGVPVLFEPSYLQELKSLKGDKGASSILKKYNDFVSAVQPDFKNLDIDTLEDYNYLLNTANG